MTASDRRSNSEEPVGILLAAGAGRRMGTPKALVQDADGTSWLVRSAKALQDGGCAPVMVVLGCEHEKAAALLDGEDVAVVIADDWAEGMGASLRAGLSAAGKTPARVAVVSLVDLPDVGSEVIRHVVGSVPSDETTLARAAYDGVPGHPVLLGRVHWSGVRNVAVGDRGARDYLAQVDVALVECGGLATGNDVDSPQKPVIGEQNGP